MYIYITILRLIPIYTATTFISIGHSCPRCHFGAQWTSGGVQRTKFYDTASIIFVTKSSFLTTPKFSRRY